jgi:His-Xaa-Ser repeat protein HxsA
MTRKFRISSLAMIGLTSVGAAMALPVAAPARNDDEYANAASLFQSFREVKPVGFKQHRSHQSHASHGSHRSSSGGARPQPRATPAPPRRTTPDRSQSTSPSSVLPSSGSSTTSSQPHQALNQLARVQALLSGYGYYTGTIDGVDGPMTRAAISRFQSDRGLAVTGSVNPQLLTALGLAVD